MCEIRRQITLISFLFLLSLSLPIRFLSSLSSLLFSSAEQLRQVCKAYFDRVWQCESQRFDLEYDVRKKEYEVERSFPSRLLPLFIFLESPIFFYKHSPPRFKNSRPNTHLSSILCFVVVTFESPSNHTWCDELVAPSLHAQLPQAQIQNLRENLITFLADFFSGDV